MKQKTITQSYSYGFKFFLRPGEEQKFSVTVKDPFELQIIRGNYLRSALVRIFVNGEPFSMEPVHTENLLGALLIPMWLKADSVIGIRCKDIPVKRNRKWNRVDIVLTGQRTVKAP